MAQTKHVRGPKPASVRSLEGVFSRKESWKKQNKHPTSLAGICLNQKSTQDLLVSWAPAVWQCNPSCPYDPYFGLDGGGEGRCQDGFTMQEKGSGLSGVTRPQSDIAGETRGHRLRNLTTLPPPPTPQAGPQGELSFSLASASSRQMKRQCWLPYTPKFWTETLT